MTQYQNVSRLKDNGEWIQVIGDNTDALLAIKAKQSTFVPKAGTSVKMIAASVRIDFPVNTTPCGEECPVTFAQTAELKFNVPLGTTATQLAALQSEVARVMNKAVTDNFLLKGLVPPSTATFVSV